MPTMNQIQAEIAAAMNPTSEALAEVRAYQAAKHAPAAALYFVECNFEKAGTAFVERNPSDADRSTTLHDLARGEWDNPVRVLEVIPGEGTCRDVSEDIAHDLAALRQPLSSGVMDFIEQHAGTRIVHEMEAA